MRGILLAFEGIDGAGKYTQLAMAKGWLERSGHLVAWSSEPNDQSSPMGRYIRAVLRHEVAGPDDPVEFQRMYVIDRAQDVICLIRPALASGVIYLIERYGLSTVAYGMLSHTPPEVFIRLHESVLGRSLLWPELTILFDLPAKEAIRRLVAAGRSPQLFEWTHRHRERRPARGGGCGRRPTSHRAPAASHNNGKKKEAAMAEKFTPEETALLREFVSDPTGDVFVVFPRAMPGMIGAAFARYSRARGGFRETLLKEFIRAGQLNPEHADELIQRILIQYGDDSVQELESAWLALEGISNVATKAVEDRRLGAYIEQSSRYVVYDERDEDGRFRYYREPIIMASPVLASYYVEVMDFVFETYCRLIEPMQEYFRRRKPIEVAEYEIREGRERIRYADCGDDAERKDFERTWRFDIRAKTCDTLRILLPAATLTNVGMHANGRVFEHMLRRLYAANLPELQVLAAKAHQALNTVIPRYVQRAKREPYLTVTHERMRQLVANLLKGVGPWEASAVTILPPGYSHIHQLALMLFPYAEHPMRQLADIVSHLSPDEQQLNEDTYLGERRSRRDRPGRALEYGSRWNIELVIDFGIYRDLHRHRMLTHERQLFTVRLGFCEIPEEIVEAGYTDDVRACVERVVPLYEDIRRLLGPEIAQYPVLFGFNVRCFFGMNDREAQHFLELRTQPQGHRSYRRVCQEIARKMRVEAPGWVERAFGFIDWNDYDWPRADSEAKQRLKEAKLQS